MMFRVTVGQGANTLQYLLSSTTAPAAVSKALREFDPDDSPFTVRCEQAQEGLLHVPGHEGAVEPGNNGDVAETDEVDE